MKHIHLAAVSSTDDWGIFNLIVVLFGAILGAWLALRDSPTEIEVKRVLAEIERDTKGRRCYAPDDHGCLLGHGERTVQPKVEPAFPNGRPRFSDEAAKWVRLLIQLVLLYGVAKLIRYWWKSE